MRNLKHICNFDEKCIKAYGCSCCVDSTTYGDIAKGKYTYTKCSDKCEPEHESEDLNMGEKEFKNALISNVSISMEDHGILTFYLMFEGDGWATNWGGYALGKGYLGAKEFKGSDVGIECLMRIMDTVGVHRWEDLKGKYVRVVGANCGDIVNEIGNITQDKWFNIKEFFSSRDKSK